MTTFSALLKLWPSRKAVAEDAGIPQGHVKQWERRDSIPSEYWSALVAGAATRGIPGVTAATMAEIAARRRAA